MRPAGLRENLLGQLGEISGRVIIGRRENASRDCVRHRRARFHNQAVQREVLGCYSARRSAENVFQVTPPSLKGLPGPTVDEIETDIAEASLVGVPEAAQGVGGLVLPPKGT